MPHHLAFLVVEGGEQGKEIPLPPQGGSVGSSPLAAVTITDQGVQEFHCVIGFDEAGVFIADEHGAGLRVNQQMFRKCALRPGDVVEIGSCKLRVVSDAPEPALALPADNGATEGEKGDQNTGLALSAGGGTWPEELTRESEGDETPLMGVLPLPIAAADWKPAAPTVAAEPPAESVPAAETAPPPQLAPPVHEKDGPLLITSAEPPRQVWWYAAAALLVVALGLAGYWKWVRRAVVMRDMSRGVVVRPGSRADTPELIVDPFPDDKPRSTNEQLAALAKKKPAATVPALAKPAEAVRRPPTPPPAPYRLIEGKDIVPQVGFGVKPPENVFRVDGDGNVANVGALGKYLQGTQNAAIDNPPTFVVQANGPCKLSVKIGKVNKWAGARLEFVLDENVVPMVTLPPGKGDDSKVGQVFELPIPKGEHRITVRNVGKDWASVEWYKVSGQLAE